MIYYVGKKRNDIQYKCIDISEALEYFKDKHEIQVDTETTGFDCHINEIICWQIGDFDNQFVINNKDYPIKNYKNFFENENKLYLFQNAKFDLRFFYKNNIFIKNIYDTFLVECILTTGLDKRELALDKLIANYCNINSIDKTIRGQIHYRGLDNIVIDYAANDVKYLSQIKQKQLKKIIELELEKLLNLENEVVKVFAKMEFDGIKLNSDKWLEVAKIVDNDIIKIKNELDNFVLKEIKLSKFVPKYEQLDLFGYEKRKININWSSAKQKLDILHALGLNVESTDSRELTRVNNKSEIVKTLLEYNKQKKLSDSFGKEFLKFINKETNRIHPNYWQVLSTGRISVSEPNVNQIPRKGELGPIIRSAFIPEKGYKIVGGDYSGRR